MTQNNPSEHARSPTLSTILMVEDVLKQNTHKPLSFAELKKKLPKQVMHQTLQVIIHYLWKSGKISYTPKIQWIHVEPEHTKDHSHPHYIG
jgi:hypothetical protein